MSNLVEYYGETQKAIFDMIVERLQKGGVYSSAKEAVQDLKNVREKEKQVYHLEIFLGNL